MSQASTQPARIDAKTFLEMPDTKGFELIDGHLRQKAKGAESSQIGGRLLVEFALFLRQDDLPVLSRGTHTAAHA